MITLFGLDIQITIRRASHIGRVIREVNKRIPKNAQATISRIKVVRELSDMFPAGTIQKVVYPGDSFETVTLVAAKEFVEKYWPPKIAA